MSGSADRISRDLAELVYDLFAYELHSALHVMPRLFLGGSYIRGLDRVGDVDIAVLGDGAAVERLFRGLAETSADWEIVRAGSKLGSAVCRHFISPVSIDWWVTGDEGAWGPLCMFVAGNGKLNIIQRAKAKRQGLVLSHTGLYPVGGTAKDRLYMPDEEAVYQRLGWPWLEYEARNV